MTAANTFPVRALLLGERLETRGLERADTIHTSPLTLRLGEDRIAVLFRYGVAVFVGLSAIEEDEVVRSLRPRISDPLAAPESDSVQIVIKPEGEDQVEPSGAIALKDASPERLQIVANVLSKSLMLSYYEAKIAGVFDRIELVERSHAMERKLALINETVGTMIDLVQNQRSVRLEWYIIGLIGIEILLNLYQLFGAGLR